MLARFGRTLGSADPSGQQLVLIFLGESDMWALVKIPWCICLGSPIFSDLWALFVSDTSRCWSFVHSSSCSLVFSPFYGCGCLQMTIHQNSWKWLVVSPISTFGDYFRWKAARVDGRKQCLRTINNDSIGFKTSKYFFWYQLPCMTLTLASASTTMSSPHYLACSGLGLT